MYKNHCCDFVFVYVNQNVKIINVNYLSFFCSPLHVPNKNPLRNDQMYHVDNLAELGSLTEVCW